MWLNVRLFKKKNKNDNLIGIFIITNLEPLLGIPLGSLISQSPKSVDPFR
jgi:hypothetical protein